MNVCRAIVVFMTFCVSYTFAQPSSIFLIPDETKNYGWQLNEEIGVQFNQVSFTNWNAGGVNSISAIVTGRAFANYRRQRLFWSSSMLLRYGINNQEGEPVRKTEDAIELISNFAYQFKADSDWFYSARFSFNTQFANGFNNPDEAPISTFMAPAYLLFGTGLEYGRNIEKLSFYFSPITIKTTFVLDDALANAGAFGVNPAIFDLEGNLLREGDKIRTEFGILLTHQYQHDIMKNVNVNSRLTLFTDYLNSFGNVDLDWEVNFNFIVNKYISASFGSHLRYDNDIKVEVTQNEITNVTTTVVGPKLQWKQLIGVGVVVDLDAVLGKDEGS